MKVDLTNTKEADSFTPLPEGWYLCKVSECIRDKDTEKGFEQWKITYQVIEGEQSGRKIWDRIFFSPDAMPRVKLVLKRLGFDVDNKNLEVEPEDLVDRQVKIEVIIDEQKYEEEGHEKKTVRNTVTFAGYEAVEQPTVKKGNKKKSGDNNLPF